MSEFDDGNGVIYAPPDPADVHTGTDRVELTADEREALRDNDSWDELDAAVESIVAARVAALTAEREELRKSLDYWVELWKKAANGVIGLQADLSEARAELAAANARCAELEAKVEAYSYWSMVQKNAALQATLDRVTALVPLWQTKAESLRQYMAEREDDGEDHVRRIVAYMTDAAANELADTLRAALTPEGNR